MSLTSRKRQQAIAAYAKVLRLTGVDLRDDEMARTPTRYVDGLIEAFGGLHETLDEAFDFTTFENRGDQLQVWRDVRYSSMCSHHVLPFFGRAWVGVLPNKKIAGYSKIPRLVRWCASRPQTQEDFVNLVADIIVEKMAPHFVMVVATGEHMCARTRGVRIHDSDFVTSAVRGEKKFSGVRDEFLRLVNIPGSRT